MGSLAFADSMTGHLVWPVVVLVLALVYRRSIMQLLGRLKRFKWGEGEAELQDIETAANNVEIALQEATAPLPEDSAIKEDELRDRIQRVMVEAVQWGFALGQAPQVRALPEIGVSWDDGTRPHLKASGLAMNDRLSGILEEYGVGGEDVPYAARSLLHGQGIVFVGNHGPVTVVERGDAVSRPPEMLQLFFVAAIDLEC